MSLRLGVRIIVLCLLALGLGARHLNAQEPGEWRLLGSELSDDSGAWRFSERVIPLNLIAAGYAYLRVTSGPCAGSPDEFDTYETSLAAPTGDDDAWFGTLQPVGRVATPLTNAADGPNAYVVPKDIDSVVTIVMDGVGPSITFQVCAR